MGDDVGHSLNWIIDGRGNVQEDWTPIDEVPESEKDSIIRTDFDSAGKEYALRLITTSTADDGKPGDRYKVRLQLLGKWRTVNWTKLDAPAGADIAPAIANGKYYIVGNWNEWQFEEMKQVSETTFSFSAKLGPHGG